MAPRQRAGLHLGDGWPGDQSRRRRRPRCGPQRLAHPRHRRLRRRYQQRHSMAPRQRAGLHLGDGWPERQSRRHDRARSGPQRLARRGRRRLQQRWQERHSLAPRQRAGLHLGDEWFAGHRGRCCATRSGFERLAHFQSAQFRLTRFIRPSLTAERSPREKISCEVQCDARRCFRLRHTGTMISCCRLWDSKGGRGMLRILFGCLLLGGAMAMPAAAQNAPGVTDGEIKIGQTMPYTGPGAPFSAVGLAEKAYMQMINDQGGVNGRKINLISVDDGFLLWRTGNETRKLIEVDHVAFTFGSIGTPTQVSVAKYLNERKIPQLFIASGAYRWGNYKETPYSIGGLAPSYRLGARLYTRHILRLEPNPKICILHEDTDFGRDYTAGVRDVLGDKFAATVREATYEFTDASIDRQIVELKATGCNALIAVTLPPFAVQAIRKVRDLGWKPIFFMNSISVSVPLVLQS